MKTVSLLYRFSILLIAFLIPSAMYELTLGVLAVTFLCWLYYGDYKNIRTTIKQPQLLFPVLLYFYIVAGFFFANHFGSALSSLSTKIPYLLFPLVIGTSSIIDEKLTAKAGRWFVFSTCIFLAVAIGYAIIDVWQTHQTTVMHEEAIYNKFSSFGLTRVFDNWHPTNVAVAANLAIAILLQKCINKYVQLKKSELFLSIIVFLFLSSCLFLLNSVNAIATYIFLLLYFCAKLFRKLRLNIITKAGLVILLAGICFSVLYFNPFKIQKIESLKNKELKITDNQEERNILTMRLAKWDTYLDVFKKHWLWGTTEGDIKFIRQKAYEEKGFHDLARYNYNAHNQYIEVLTSYGVIGSAIFLCLLLMPLLKKEHSVNYVPFLLIVSIAFCTESLLERQQGILFFMFIYTLYTHPHSLKQAKDVPL